MKYLQSFFGVIVNFSRHFMFLVIALAVSNIQIVGAQELGDHQYTSEAIERGSRIYSRECALCHGPQGDIVDGVNLRVGIFKNVRSDDDLRTVVSQGAGQGQMPAFGLNAADLDGIVAFIRAGFDPDGVAVRIGDPARGRVIFEG